MVQNLFYYRSEYYNEKNVMPFETVTIKPGKLFHHIVEGFVIPAELKHQVEEFWLTVD